MLAALLAPPAGKWVSVLLSASFERFSVSRMQNFVKEIIKCYYLTLHIEKGTNKLSKVLIALFQVYLPVCLKLCKTGTGWLQQTLIDYIYKYTTIEGTEKQYGITKNINM